jgi:kynurenine formamidase
VTDTQDTGLEQQVHELAERVRNWNRWGPDDELGTLNFITPEKRARAATLVRTGKLFSLQIPMDKNGPMNGTTRVNPQHSMKVTGTDTESPIPLALNAGFTDDVMFLYLQSGTEWDALAHIYYDGALYNGYPASAVDSRGAAKLGIDKTCSSYVSRGVLLDVPRHRGVDVLAPEDRITGEELDAIAAAQGVAIESGDIVLLRTGALVDWSRTGSWESYRGPGAGLHFTSAEWLHDHEIAAIAADNNAVEGAGSRVPAEIPLHMLGLRDMGMCFGETFYLEELAEDCAADRTYECMLVAPALRVTGGVGSPVNPLALK